MKFPEGWIGPFKVFGWGESYCVVNGDQDNTAIIDDLTKEEAIFLCALMERAWEIVNTI